MGNVKKKLVAGAVLCSVFVTGAFAGGTAINATMRPDIKVNVDGSTKTFYDAKGTQVYPISYNNTTYLPIRAIGGLMGKTVGWDEATQTISLDTPSSNNAATYGRTNPAPVGTQQTVKITGYISNYTATLTVVDVDRGDSAWEKIKAANQFNRKPDDGMEYILAKIKATVVATEDDKAVDFSNYSFDVYSATNVEYSAFAAVVKPSPEFSGKVYKDGTLEGYAVFMVDKTDTAPKIVYGASYDGSGGIWFSLSK